MLSPKILIIFVFVLILGFGAVGAMYYFQNSNSSSNPLSILNGPVTSEPASLTLEVTSPTEDSLSFEPNMVVSGRTSPESQVLISSELHDLVIESKKDGGFSTLFDLTEGVNNLQIIVFDNNGDERAVNRTVFYSKEKLQ